MTIGQITYFFKENNLFFEMDFLPVHNLTIGAGNSHFDNLRATCYFEVRP